VSQIRPTYFGIAVSTIKYINVWILTKLIGRIRVIMQLFMDLSAVQCTPTGRLNLEKYMQTLRKLRYNIRKSIKANGLLTPLQIGRFEWQLIPVCIPQTASRSTMRSQSMCRTESDTGPERFETLHRTLWFL
jgi:hypothetical protein